MERDEQRPACKPPPPALGLGSLPATPPIISPPYKNRGQSSADQPGPLLIRDKKIGHLMPAFPILGDATNPLSVVLSPPKRLCVAINHLIIDVTSFLWSCGLFPPTSRKIRKRRARLLTMKLDHSPSCLLDQHLWLLGLFWGPNTLQQGRLW